MKLRKLILPAVLFILLFHTKTFSQTQDSATPVKIAVLLPLYIDSAFNNFDYKLHENYIPQYILTGLTYYNGVMLAADSLQKEGANIEIHVYDTKKKDESISTIINEMKPLNFSMVIASFNNTNEQKIVSDYSFSNNIPLISSTYPNDAGIISNPFFIMLNSTFKTHVEGIYKYAYNNYSGSKIMFITKQGFLEEKIKNVFTALNQLPHLLKYNQITLTDNFLPDNLLPLMDSTKQNVIICGSFDQNFATRLVQTISAANVYNTTVLGMPDWDGIKALNQNESDGVQIIYSTPFNFSRNDSMYATIVSAYKQKYYAHPSDMVFKGFETMYHFTHLLLQYKTDFINHLSDTSFKISNNFSIQPVKLNTASFVPDYLENKTLYYVKKLNGKIESVTQMADQL
jgi:ABC-type branched-subunit amino acid transport system substrate-binding protein